MKQLSIFCNRNQYLLLAVPHPLVPINNLTEWQTQSSPFSLPSVYLSSKSPPSSAQVPTNPLLCSQSFISIPTSSLTIFSSKACDRNEHLCQHRHRSDCCNSNEHCFAGICFPNKPPKTNQCRTPSATVCHTQLGLLCCSKDQTCGSNQCVDKVPDPTNTCEFGTTLCNNIDGADCCTADEKCSNGICVANNFCNAPAGATKPVVCQTSTGLLCCAADQTCGDNQCVNKTPDPNACPEAGTTACVNIDGTSCCTAAQICSAGLCVAK